ncbi:MAG TPA: hypothetical protein DCY48_00955 [Candidatus Magasanikbacteria bacterium]|nr:MAG: hypothetical protein A3I74_01955 [Candidatus Magasanikbacteria bacterium RIFCSPLOWO2_02_FULL_47_16]OGH79815.1 MAG: hypothetical protein A3C10_05135 [Candidatus Magasanikbacteria bacterium RIFCSPHIGHO2_02_FULL_48_18]OGH83037.1 MAG: hypothetical protein A3G08_01310 [Candidatus Magasanikbacteria bacterium RIFCSPLOWO2_12_FULL_47_9b]HAZ28329.1 hypothetical protein [Candidatus Magasanikbacteria bacterium]
MFTAPTQRANVGDFIFPLLHCLFCQTARGFAGTALIILFKISKIVPTLGVFCQRAKVKG